MKRRRLFFSASAPLVAACVAGFAWGAFVIPPRATAESFTETFTAGSAGWGGAAGDVAFADGEARLAFSALPGPPLPQAAILVCSNGSSGAFRGNYSAGGAHIIGFDFRADSREPAVLNLAFRGAGMTFQRALTPLVSEPGRWYTLAVSVTGKDRGAWVGPGDEEAFANALASVESVSIKVDRPDAAARSYRIDNVYLDSAPAARWQATPEGPRLAWGPLRSNRAYTVLVSTDLVNGAWVPAHAFQATDASALLEVGDDPLVFQRIEGTTD
ncbi:MAG TPA: hypothetical protein PKE12_02405 [Kiritimatiellia bacterium]|nr:hypothetical protein [Kiritimatiellia bacterium]